MFNNVKTWGSLQASMLEQRGSVKVWLIFKNLECLTLIASKKNVLLIRRKRSRKYLISSWVSFVRNVQRRSRHSHAVQTVWGLFETVSLSQVIINLAVFDPRVRSLAPSSDLPHGDSKRPLRERERGELWIQNLIFISLKWNSFSLTCCPHRVTSLFPLLTYNLFTYHPPEQILNGSLFQSLTGLFIVDVLLCRSSPAFSC